MRESELLIKRTGSSDVAGLRAMSLEEKALRQAINEATNSMVSELQLAVKMAVEEVLRDALPAELQKALPPVLTGLWEEMRTHSSSPTNAGHAGQLGVPGKKPLRRLSSAVSVENVQGVQGLGLGPSHSMGPLGRRSSLASLKQAVAAFSSTQRNSGRSHTDVTAQRKPGRSQTDVSSAVESVRKMYNSSSLERIQSQDQNLSAREGSPTLPDAPMPVVPSAPPNEISPKRSTSSLMGDEDDEGSASEQMQLECRVDGEGEDAVTMAESLAIVPGVFAAPTQKSGPVPAWRKALRSLRRLVSWTKSPPPEDNKVRKILLNSQNRSAKIPGRSGRRSAVLLQEVEMQELQRRPARLFHWSWPFSDPHGRPRQYWEIFACILHIVQLLYLCFEAAFITDADYHDHVYWDLKVALVVADIFWAIDLGLNFTTGYRDATQVLHSDARSNMKRYLQSLDTSIVSPRFF